MQEKNRPSKDIDHGDIIVSDGIAVRHFLETRGYLFRPK